MASISNTIKMIRAQYPTVMAKHDTDWNCIKMTTVKNSRGQADYDNGPEIDLGHTKESKAEALAEMFDVADLMTAEV
jgi:hypothetical protein